MRAIRFDAYGDPAEVLKLVDVDKPSPKPGEVLIRMKLRAINPYELLIIKGVYRIRPPLPASAGFEGIGIVEELGEGVTHLKVGMRVIAPPVMGTWQEYVAGPAVQAIPVPDSVSDEAAAQMSNVLAAWIVAVEELDLKEGDWFLQTGGTSHIGRLLIQLSKVRGFKTISLVRKKQQVEELKAIGADEVIWTQGEDFVARVSRITGGAGVKGILDAVSGELATKAVKTLAPSGIFLTFGNLSNQPFEVNPSDLVGSGGSVRGFWMMNWILNAPLAKVQATLGAAFTLLAQGKMNPPVAARYDLSEISQAAKHSGAEGRGGKILLEG